MGSTRPMLVRSARDWLGMWSWHKGRERDEGKPGRIDVGFGDRRGGRDGGHFPPQAVARAAVPETQAEVF